MQAFFSARLQQKIAYTRLVVLLVRGTFNVSRNMLTGLSDDVVITVRRSGVISSRRSPCPVISGLIKKTGRVIWKGGILKMRIHHSLPTNDVYKEGDTPKCLHNVSFKSQRRRGAHVDGELVEIVNTETAFT